VSTVNEECKPVLCSIPAKPGNIDQISLLWMLTGPDCTTGTTQFRLFPSNAFSLIHYKVIKVYTGRVHVNIAVQWVALNALKWLKERDAFACLCICFFP